MGISRHCSGCRRAAGQLLPAMAALVLLLLLSGLFPATTPAWAGSFDGEYHGTITGPASGKFVLILRGNLAGGAVSGNYTYTMGNKKYVDPFKGDIAGTVNASGVISARLSGTVGKGKFTGTFKGKADPAGTAQGTYSATALTTIGGSWSAARKGGPPPPAWKSPCPQKLKAVQANIQRVVEAIKKTQQDIAQLENDVRHYEKTGQSHMLQAKRAWLAQKQKDLQRLKSKHQSLLQLRQNLQSICQQAEAGNKAAQQQAERYPTDVDEVRR